MDVRFARGHHLSLVERYFEPAAIDPFYNEEVLATLYGSNWNSVLITESENAFFHTFSKQRIAEQELFDIEPRLGYAGPLLNTNDAGFAHRALAEYSHLCRSENIVAELVRFNPLLQNHVDFVDSPLIDISPAKEISITRCFADEASQLAEFSNACGRRIRRGARDACYRKLTNSAEIEAFMSLYRQSLDRVGAAAAWQMEDGTFERMVSSRAFAFHGVFADSELVSTCLTVEGGFTAYYLLAANSYPHTPGASELLIHSVVRDCSTRGVRHLVLGGGNTSSPGDTLLRFKRKFSKHTETFFIGKIIHNSESFDMLSARHASQTECFLSYRASATVS